MATTRIMPLHVGKGRTESRAISDIIDYVANPQKTDNGKLITGYACDSRTADAEFLLAKRQYIAATGRVRGADDVIAYHVRQSFRPGEITPEEANRLGVEFAKRFTKGNHAFVVCTHIDKSHIHNHIIWSSVSLEYDRKFRNFWGSTKAVRRLSDTICIENGLSIVENPKPHGKSYNKWLGDQAKPSHRELLRVAILNLWKVVNRHEVLDNEPWSESISILQTLDTLTSYPNEFWKYPVITYYLTYRSLPDFSLKFEKFLNKLLKELLTKYILMPTINAVKSDIIRLNVEIISSSIPPFDFKSIDTSQLDSKIKNPHRNAVRMLLKIIAYKSQTSLLPDKWEIEHIFPQKWQTNFFLDVPDDIIKEKIEHIGNKLPFEKQLNITAGNGYFKKKKVEYAKSHIVITHDMSNSDLMDWNLDNIVERDVRVTDDVLKTLNQWENDYSALQSQSRTIDAPSPEQLAIIAQFKEKGWI